MYAGFKQLHMVLVYVSIAGFFLRGIWMMMESPWLQRKWVRVLPHIVDTLLLLAGVTLAIMISQYPGTHAWLTAKIAGLIGYIVLGVFALREGRTRMSRGVFFLLALITYAWMISVARSKNPMGFLAGLIQ
jgi:uncharacterized membrane protein SirB2